MLDFLSELGGAFLWLVLIAIIVWLVVTNIRIVPQANAFVIERLGAYNCTWDVGIHFKIPLIDKVAKKVSLKENVIDFLPQPVITKDNVTMEIDTVVYFQITEPKLYTYGVDNPMSAVENLTATTLRNIIGELDLDATLTGRDYINSNIRSVLDEATDPWGIKINRVEVKNITPPREIQDAMEKQMKAEREKREAILRAEGEKKSSVLVAEGNKEVAILQAKGIVMLKESNPSSEVLALKSFEALEKVADGQATKIIIPSELQNISGFASSVAEVMRK